MMMIMIGSTLKRFVDYENGPPLKIQREVTEECYQKANSKVNLAVQLVKRVYSRKERATSNCSGDHRFAKKKLSPTRMTAVKDALYGIYPVRPSEKEETMWKEFKIAIDSSCRQLNKPKQTHTHVLRYCMCIYNTLSLSYTMSLFYYVNLY